MTGNSRRRVTGTFMAERTHQDPPVYSLVSVSSSASQSQLAATGADGQGVGTVHGSGHRGRGVFNERAPIQCTVLDALRSDEHLLMPGESVQLPAIVGRSISSRFRNARDTLPEKAAAKGEPLQRLQGHTADTCPDDTVVGPRPSSVGCPGSDSDVFIRLTRGVPQPWVASRTDSELLSYLAERTRGPKVAALPPIKASSLSCASSASSLSSNPRNRQFRNHHELFDECLSRGQQSRTLSSPKTSTSLRGGRRLSEQVEDIKVLPEDPVSIFFLHEDHSTAISPASLVA